MSNDILKEHIKIAVETGATMLRNGAETYRVEDTVLRILQKYSFSDAQVFVIPTGIFVSVELDGLMTTHLQRIKLAGIDLERISRANQFSRDYVSGAITIEEAWDKLKEINDAPTFPKPVRYAFAGIAGAFFSLLYGCTLLESVLSFIASALTILAFDTMSDSNINFFMKNIAAGFIAGIFGAVFAAVFKLFGISVSMDMIILGPLMTLVPGVALTNAMRDIISGELVAGSTKLMEALFIAIAIAFGVGLTIQFRAILGVM